MAGAGIRRLTRQVSDSVDNRLLLMALPSLI
jgi:hypothetical protein